jgi:DNA modification methylase
VWEINPEYDDVHEAVFPEELCDRIITHFSFVNDLVLDPFAGSGTVGRSAIKNRRYYTLIERKKVYVKRSIELIRKYEVKSVRKFLKLPDTYEMKKIKVLKDL